MKKIGTLILLTLCMQILHANDWKRVYLASFPRSGNHWTRFLIEEATGICYELGLQRYGSRWWPYSFI